MADRLTIHLDGIRAGEIDRGRSDGLSLRYHDEYRFRDGAVPLSTSLPLTDAVHRGEVVEYWIDNLLPDNDVVRHRWATMFDERRATPFNLLKHMGADCAGAVQFLPDGETADTYGAFVPLSNDDIAAHLRALRQDDSAWTFEESGGRWSLGGQQGKFALALGQERTWGLPTGRVPSTHIFKIGIAHLGESDAAEYVSMRAAQTLGLRVAGVELRAFSGEPAVVVERFDRRHAGSWPPARIHQEDVCQALGLSRSLKYQADGGPSFADVSTLIGDTVRAPRVEGARLRLAEAALFNWLAAGTDAHAKNFALLHVPSGTELAPLYDLMSAVLVEDAERVYFKGKLAMKIAGRYELRRIGWPEIEKAAVELQVDADWLVARGREMHAAMPEAFAKAVADAGDAIAPEVGKRFVEAIEERARQTRPL
ncbi:type II toxin-antitoxin system HipA family toxin [Myceligenerans halotolerans]